MDPEMLVPSEANPWRRIRAVRFSQSEAEANSYRRQVFVAALEQAEQMWFAAVKSRRSQRCSTRRC